MLQLDPTLVGKQIALRPSQIKFPSASISLAIVGSFTALPAFLNRPLIVILSALGAPDSAFLRLQRKAIKLLETDCKTLRGAYKALRKWHVGVGGGTKLAETLSWLAESKSTERAASLNPFLRKCIAMWVLLRFPPVFNRRLSSISDVAPLAEPSPTATARSSTERGSLSRTATISSV